MKKILSILFIGCLAQLCPAQTLNSTQEYEIRITTGRRTGCFGSGMCTITKVDDIKHESQANAILITKKNGSAILRVYRERLTTQEESKLMGAAITNHNKSSIKFKMEEILPLIAEIKQITSSISSNQLSVLPVGSYATLITDKYIDITLVN